MGLLLLTPVGAGYPNIGMTNWMLSVRTAQCGWDTSWTPKESAEFAALRFQSERAALLLRCRDSSIGAVLTPDRTTFSRPWLSNK